MPYHNCVSINFLVSAKGFSKTQPVAELVSEIFRLRPGELENPRTRTNWDKFVQVIKGIYNSIRDQAKIINKVLINYCNCHSQS